MLNVCAELDVDHFKHWGKMYDAKDVKIEWHMPSAEEIDFILELLTKVVEPAMDVLDRLLQGSDQYWDNDFCRYMHMIRSAWSGLPTLILEQTPELAPLSDEFDTDIIALRARHLNVRAGFTLADLEDPRFQQVAALRSRFGDILHRSSVLLGQQSVDEDHIDPVLALIRAMDVHMLEYGVTRQAFGSLTKNHAFARKCVVNVLRIGLRKLTTMKLEPRLESAEALLAPDFLEARPGVSLRTRLRLVSVSSTHA